MQGQEAKNKEKNSASFYLEENHKKGDVILHYNFEYALKNPLDYKQLYINGDKDINKLNKLEKFENLEQITLNCVTTTILPKGIIKLKKLKRISFRSVHHFNYDKFFELIKDLDIEEIEINVSSIGEIPVDIFNFKKLKKLKIHNSRVCSIPDEIGRLKELESLILYYNDIDDISIKLGELPNLKILDLEGNPLFGYNNFEEFYNIIKTNVSLEEINLRKTCLRRFPYELGEMPMLKDLDLSLNRITEVGPISGFKRLERLNLILTKVYFVPEKYKNIFIIGMQDN